MANRPRVTINTDLSDGLCFGCGKNNPFGLKLVFKKEGDTVRAEFTPTKFYQGWHDILHGGVIASLLDEAMGWASRFAGLHCVTAKLQVNFKRPILVGQRLIITGTITHKSGRTVKTEARITLRNGTVMAEGTGVHTVITAGETECLGKE